MKYYFILIFSFQILLTSCDEEDQDINANPIESDLLLSFEESYPNGEVTDPVLTLAIETEEQYPCVNYEILSTTTLEEGHLQIDVLGVVGGPICATAIGPATSSVELDNSVKSITISKNNFVDEFSVTVDDSAINIVSSTATFSSFGVSCYARFPEKSFVLFCRTLKRDSVICDQFEQHLLSKIDLSEFALPAGCKVPYPQDDGGSRFNAPAKHYKYQLENDLTNAGEILSDFYKSELSNKGGLSISIRGWNNTYFINDQRIN